MHTLCSLIIFVRDCRCLISMDYKVISDILSKGPYTPGAIQLRDAIFQFFKLVNKAMYEEKLHTRKTSQR